MSRISAGEAFVSVSVDNKNLLSGLKEASARIQETTRTFNASKSALNPNLSISGADAFRASLREVRREAEQTANAARKLSDRFVITAGDIYHAFRGAAATLTNLLGGVGDEFDKMAARTGLSTEALSEYAHAAKMSGADINAVESALRSLATQLVAAQNGSARARKSFEILGLNIDSIAALNPEQQFDAIARAIGSIADPTARAGAAMKIFGSAGASLLPLFNEGPDGLAKLRAEARRLGVSIDKETAKIGADFDDAQTRVRTALQGIGISLSRIITPEIVKASNAVAAFAGRFREFADNNPTLTNALVGTTTAVAALSSAIFIGGKAWTAFAGAAVQARAALAKLTAAALANPWTALAVAIGAAVAAVVAYRAAASNVPKFSDKAQTDLTNENAARDQDRADLERLKTLERISRSQQLSNDEIAEAARLAEQLRQKYGDVGISVDTVTGKIKGAVAAQTELNNKILASQADTLRAAIEEARANDETGALEAQLMKEETGWFERLTNKKRGHSWGEWFREGFGRDGADGMAQGVGPDAWRQILEDDPEFQRRLEAARQKNRANIAAWQAELDAIEATMKRSTEQAANPTVDQSALNSANDAVAEFIRKGTGQEKSALEERIDMIVRNRNRLIDELRKIADPNGEVDWNDPNAVDDFLRRNPTAAGIQQQALAVDASANAQIQRERDAERQRLEQERQRQLEEQRRQLAEQQKAKADGDKALEQAMRDRFEKYATPFEKLELAQQDLQQAMRELADAQRTGDSATIAAALNRLGETEDKYQSVSDAVMDISTAVGRSVGGTFNAWQAASVASVDFDKQSLYEQRTQTGYLRQIVANTRRQNGAVFA